jgi:hypothetical protein
MDRPLDRCCRTSRAAARAFVEYALNARTADPEGEVGELATPHFAGLTTARTSRKSLPQSRDDASVHAERPADDLD